MVATYRSDELHRRHPLRPVLAELERAPRARRLELERFDHGELADQLADILGEAPDAEVIERVYGRSEGNPLFTEELVAAGAGRLGALPPSLSEALLLRVERLPDATPAPAAPARGRRSPTTRLLAAASGLEQAPSRRRSARRSPPRSWSPTPLSASAFATRCCARCSSTTCCRANAPSFTCGSPRRSRGCARPAGRSPRPRSPTTTTQPATSRGRWRARSRPRRRSAAARLRRGRRPARPRDRALGAGAPADRLPAGPTRPSCSPRPGAPTTWRARTSAAIACTSGRSRSSTRRPTLSGSRRCFPRGPRARVVAWPGRLSARSRSARWRSSPADDDSEARAQLLAQRVRFLMLQRPLQRGPRGGRRGARGRRRVGSQEAVAAVLNRLGCALIALGEEQEGRAAAARGDRGRPQRRVQR